MKARRRWAWPLVPAYSAALAAEDALRAMGFPAVQRLGWPVISVGSVSVGGAGKTPVVIALARLLGERGWTVDVLSRGFGRSGVRVEQVEQVDPQGGDAARRYGDEPVLIAQRTGVPVWVGAKRYAAGIAAERSFTDRLRAPQAPETGVQPGPSSTPKADADRPLRAHLLDDGLQHRALHRQFDLVLITEADLRDTLLPAGNLREPLSALRRADAFAVREEELERVSGQLRRLGRPEVPVWTLRRALHFPAPLGVFGAGLRPLAFCALARPESFATMLTGAGCGLVDTVVFSDHHRYEEQDVSLLTRTAKEMHATGFITTEKDAVKISPALRSRLEAEVGPLMVVRLDVQFVYESPVVRTLEDRLRAGQDAGSRIEAPAL